MLLFYMKCLDLQRKKLLLIPLQVEGKRGMDEEIFFYFGVHCLESAKKITFKAFLSPLPPQEKRCINGNITYFTYHRQINLGVVHMYIRY